MGWGYGDESPKRDTSATVEEELATWLRANDQVEPRRRWWRRLFHRRRA